jgi:8-oxo-dGTP pyrophosphatase MutT (NUDIX family)
VAESLETRLAPLLLTPEQAVSLDVHGRTDAAVLVPVFERDGALHAVFTRRRDDLRRHAGEISFPGGRQDPGEDLRQTALREADEEIGLDPTTVNVIGALAPTPTVVTSYAIYPFVGIIEPSEWNPSEGEVAEILELSLPALKAGYGRERLIRRGLPFRTDVYKLNGALIWGATARILGDLFERLDPVLMPNA